MGAKPPAIAAITGDDDFYVEPDCCLLCGVPEDIAPEVFQTGENYCFVRRQPCSQDELDRTIRAMWSSEVDCIRYRGQDAELLARLARAGMSDQLDHPHQLNARFAPRDQVSFSDMKSAAPVHDEVRSNLINQGLKLVDISLAHKVRVS